MQTSPKPSFFIKPSFLDKDSAGTSGVSLGAFVIVVLLSVAFLWYETTNLPSNHSSVGGNDHGVIDHSVIDHGQNNRTEPTEGDVAATGSPLLTTPFRLVRYTSANSSFGAFNATLAPDNTMWRYTSDGWRDISMAVDPPPANKPFIEGVHPAIWTAMLLLASLLLLVRASSDEELKTLLSRSSNHKKISSYKS